MRKGKQPICVVCPPTRSILQSWACAAGRVGAGGTGGAAAGGAALGNGVPASASKQDGGGDSPGASASNPLASLLGYRCVPEQQQLASVSRGCQAACQDVPAHRDCMHVVRVVTAPAAGSSNEEESGSESGDTDEREAAEPGSPAGKAASAASGDGMDAEVRSRINCLGELGLDPAMQFSWLLPSAGCLLKEVFHWMCATASGLYSQYSFRLEERRWPATRLHESKQAVCTVTKVRQLCVKGLF